jgi:protein ImuB
MTRSRSWQSAAKVRQADGLVLWRDRQAAVQQILAILHKWGIHTLGQLAALDKDELAARLGVEAVRMWERANGQSDRPLKFVQPPESFEERFEFENEIETAEPLLFILRRFLQQLSLRLSAVYHVVKELTLRITFSNPPRDGFAAANKETYERVFKIPQPTNDVDLLFRMLHTHLENFKSEYPIIAVSLQAEPAKPSRQQFGLFETSLRDPNQLYETLARLVALLGSDRVGTPVLEETHRPDAFRMEPFVWELTSAVGHGGRSSATPGFHPQARRSSPLHNAGPALRRFRPNVSASVLLADEQPIHLRSEQISGAVSGQRGPYRASGNWWDEKIWSRSEWDLELNDSAILRCHENPNGWQIDGIYD